MKLIAKTAASDAMMKSQASAMSQPRPMAGPLTAAMVGLPMPCMDGDSLMGALLAAPAVEGDLAGGSLEPLLHAGNVAAGAEGLALSGQDDGADAIVAGEPVEDFDQLRPHGVADRVAGRRPVEGDDGDLIFDGEFDMGRRLRICGHCGCSCITGLSFRDHLWGQVSPSSASGAWSRK